MQIGFRFFLTEHPEQDWTQIPPFLQGIHNNSVSASTGFVPNEFLYGFKVNDIVGLLSDLPNEDLDRLRSHKRQEAEMSLAFASALSEHTLRSQT